MARTRSVPRCGDVPRLWAAVVVVVLASVLGDGTECRADRIALRGGGEIRGKVVPDVNLPDRVTVVMTTGKTPLTFPKAQILKVTPEPSVLDDYVTRRAQAGRDAEAQYELGLWCASQRLADLAEVHYEAALAHDKTYAPAHRKLGHVLVGDRWLNADEVREAQGLVRYKGKWVTKEEREAQEAGLAAGAERASWVRRIRLLRQAIAHGSDERAREAEQQLQEIRDPVAIGPLVRVLGRDEPGFRLLLDDVLGMIPGSEAAAALAGRILAEPDSQVRDETLARLETRREENVVPILVKALRSTNPEVVNRAAWALAGLGAVAAVPRLIPALISTKYQMEMEPGSTEPPPSPLNSIGVPIATNGSSVAFLRPPAVGPGVVAYGATSVPATPDLYSALAAGGGSGYGPANRGPVFRLTAYSFQNVEVHRALVELTGQDFGYNVAHWRRWLDRSFRTEAAPARRVPQP